MIEFEWDQAKAKSNEQKHGVKFEDAIKVFRDPSAVFREDFANCDEEQWQAIGIASGITVLLVVHTVKMRDQGQTEVIRIISARAAMRKEQAIYDRNRS